MSFPTCRPAILFFADLLPAFYKKQYVQVYFSSQDPTFNNFYCKEISVFKLDKAFPLSRLSTAA